MNDLILIGVGISFVIISNLTFSYLIVNKALNRSIVPKLQKQGLKFIKLEKIGFGNTGSFNNWNNVILISTPNRKYKIDLYRKVYYKDKSKKGKTTTVKIKWNLFRKTQIEFKPKL